MSAIGHLTLSPDSADSLQILTQKLLSAGAGAIGAGGGSRIADTAAHSGLRCFCIVPLADTVFTTLTGNITGTVTGVTFPAGIPIYGLFTVIRLTSGSVMEYELPL